MSEIGNIIRDTQAGWLKEKARADALAVDVERLTRDYKIKYDICVSLDAHVAAEKAANERLRAAIEAAPHGEVCACGLPVVRGNDLNLTIETNAVFVCDCWKSKALEGSAR
jgi:hypothetical protein